MPPLTMHAMLLDAARQPLRIAELPLPEPGPQQLRLRVTACGVCRTDLHIVDGELTDPKLPLVLGHEIVGRVEALGAEVEGFAIGDRVGVPWLGFTDGTCPYCRTGRENLCDHARFTGYQIDGGYASHTRADARYCFHLPEGYTDAEAAPLLCAGLIGYRSLKMTGNEAPRHLWLRRRGPCRGAGGATSGTPNLCLHAPRLRSGAGPRSRAWRGVGGRLGRSAA